jgi:hypothetical protein
MTEDGLIYCDAEYPFGLMCAAKDCGHVFTDGERYSERLDGFQGELPIVVITCVPCGLSMAELAE